MFQDPMTIYTMLYYCTRLAAAKRYNRRWACERQPESEYRYPFLGISGGVSYFPAVPSFDKRETARNQLDSIMPKSDEIPKPSSNLPD